jgi:RNA polymerase sigma factor (sigma-70 family)
MQEDEPALVLHLEAATQSSMNDERSDSLEDTSQTSPSDEELMVAFSRGQADAFSTLFARYKQPVFGFFRRRVADTAQAEELTQETFLAILRAAGRYEPAAMFRTYLYAVGFKILRTYCRKAAFRATFLGEQSPDREPAIDDAIETRTLMLDAVEKLESLDREVLLLREFEQLSYAEIAELLCLPVNTVRSRLFRARQTLHDLLATRASGIATHELAQVKERI